MLCICGFAPLKLCESGLHRLRVAASAEQGKANLFQPRAPFNENQAYGLFSFSLALG